MPEVAVLIRDLVAFSLLPASRRRTAALLTLLGPPTDEPGAHVLERLIELSERDAVDAAAQAAGLRRKADGLLDAAAQGGIEPIGLLDARYPPRLRSIPDPPAVLYMRGEPASLSTPSIAIVGSRAASPYGLSVAAQLGRDLAAAGLTVVSGLARGCDAAAHQGALDAGGLTVGVLGCGADIVYPAEHRNLYRSVAERGAIVSELPPGAPPLPGHFPRRNRIISGLAGGVVVIEASARSGSLITAACALEQGRDVMAVPGNVLSQRHTGCHDLLRDGARLVQSAQDVLDELGWSSPAPRKASLDGQQSPATEPLLGCLPPGEDCDVETLAQRSGLPVAALLGRMTRLELTGAVRRTPGGRFVRAVP
jgi:DNA processing protein